MRTIVLCKVAGQLFGIEKETIATIAATKNKKIRKVEHKGEPHLLLSKGRLSKIYNLAELFYSQSEESEDSQYFLIDVGGELLTLLVSEKGGLATVPSNSLGKLPPVFGHDTQTIFPETLLNANDVILMLSPRALAAMF